MLRSIIARAALLTAFAVASLSGCIVVKDNGDNGRRDRGASGNSGGSSGSSGGGSSSAQDSGSGERLGKRGEKYAHLPKKGYLEAMLPQDGNMRGTIILERGVYRVHDNRIKFSGGGLTLIGQGNGQTVIDGDMIAIGDAYVFKQLTVNGDCEIKGNNNTVAIHIEGSREIKGANIQYGNMTSSESFTDTRPQNNPQPAQQDPTPAADLAPAQPAGLPDMGSIEQYLPDGMRGECFLKAGVYKCRNGTLKLSGGGLTIQGAGKGQTIIEGDVMLKGDGYVLANLTVQGDIEVHGNNNTGDIKIKGKKKIRGGGNRGF